MKVVIDGVEYVEAPPKPTGKGLLEALEVRFSSDVGSGTIREYLHALLLAVWEEGEGFSGKRPFGNSGWEFDLYVPLAKEGFLDLGPLDRDVWTEEQLNVARDYVRDLIDAALFGVES